MIKTELIQRLTYNFADGWSAFDDVASLGTLTLTPPRLIKAGNGHDQGGTYVQHATLPKGVPRMIAKAALADTMGGTSCRHEHDCCGCEIRSIQSLKVGNRRFLVRTRITYNA